MGRDHGWDGPAVEFCGTETTLVISCGIVFVTVQVSMWVRKESRFRSVIGMHRTRELMAIQVI